MDIKVNKAEWDTLDDLARKQITAVITGNFKGSTIVPDPNGPAILKGKAVPLSNPFCEAACNIAENATKGACFLLSNPIAIAVCITAAEEAGKECRKRC